MNSKAKIFVFLSILFFVLGGVMLYISLSGEKGTPFVLAGIGPIIMGIAMLILSRRVK